MAAVFCLFLFLVFWILDLFLWDLYILVPMLKFASGVFFASLRDDMMSRRAATRPHGHTATPPPSGRMAGVRTATLIGQRLPNAVPYAILQCPTVPHCTLLYSVHYSVQLSTKYDILSLLSSVTYCPVPRALEL